MTRAIPILLACILSPGAVGAEEPVAIGTVLGEPEPYHLKQVTLHGTVARLRLLDPYYQASGAACYGAYLFTLADASGSLDIVVLGLCGMPTIRAPLVEEGDEVEVTARVMAPDLKGHIRGFDGSPFPTHALPGIYAVADTITREDPLPLPEDMKE